MATALIAILETVYQNPDFKTSLFSLLMSEHLLL